MRELGSHKGSLTFVRFRWVTLQLHYLCRIKVASLVEKRLGKLPQDLWKIYHETYTERFGEYQEDEAAVAQSALRWLICSQVPLDTETFLSLASSSAYQRPPTLSISRDDMLDLCFNFVVHDAGLNVFRFSHLSVREYLERTEHYQLEKCHAFAAEYCLRTLTSDLSINQTHLNDHENYVIHSLAGYSGVDEYVCIYWPHHLKQSGVHRHLEPLKTLFCGFTMEQQTTSSYFSQWNKKVFLLQGKMWIHNSSLYSRENIVISFPSDPVFVACVWGFEELLHWRVNIDTRSLDVQNRFEMTALHITCQFGNVEAARMLIEKGILRQATVNGRRALELATLHHHLDILQLLINKGVCSNKDIANVLHETILTRYTAMALKLVDLGVDLHATMSESTCCAFHLAVENGQALVVEKMLERTGVGENEKNEWLARTRLMVAVTENAEVTALFQEDGFGSLLDQETLQAALWRSYWNSNVKAAKILIDAGADVNIGRSCHMDFQIASRAHEFRPGRKDMMHDTRTWGGGWWVRKHNVRLATGYGFGNLLLEEVITQSMGDDFVELLLDSGALTDPPAFQGQLSPLETAIRTGREDYVNILIERGARIDRTDYELATGPTDLFLGSLLDMAESRGYVGIARLLSRRGAPSAVRRLTNQQYKELKEENIYELEGEVEGVVPMPRSEQSRFAEESTGGDLEEA